MPRLAVSGSGLLGDEARRVLDDLLGLPELHFLEACIDCEACAAACPFREAVSRRYSPMRKAEHMRRMYRAVYTLSGRLLGRLVGARLPRSDDEIVAILNDAYHCSYCGSCYYTCPHGVDSGLVVKMLRGVLHMRGLAPPTLASLARAELDIVGGSIPGSVAYEWERFLEDAKARHNIEGRPDRSQGLLMVDVYTITVNRENLEAYMNLLDAAGVRYSLPDKPLGVRPPLPIVVGDYRGARRVAEHVYNYAASRGYRRLIIVDGGYPYNELKYSYNYYRASKPDGLAIDHVASVLHDRYLEEGLPAYDRWGRAAYIPSCNIDTRGGVAAGAKLVELTAAIYDKHLMWPYSGAGPLSMLCPRAREALEAVLGELEGPDALEEELVEHIKLVGEKLARDSARTSPGMRVYSCTDDLLILAQARARGSGKSVHLAQWLSSHLAR